MINNVVLTGRLTKDVEVRETTNGNVVANYTLAVKRSYEDESDFIGIVAFGKSGEFAEKYFKKGMLVGVNGRINVNSYEDDNGWHNYVNVIAEQQHFLEKKREDENDNNSNGRSGNGRNNGRSGNGRSGNGSSNNR